MMEEKNNMETKETPIEPGNVNLIYPIRDSGRFVDGIEGYNEHTNRNERKELQLKAMSLLWAVRSHPEYWGYESSMEEPVMKLLGMASDLEEELSRFDSWRPETESPKSTMYRGFDVQCQTVHIPRPNEKAKRGLQTDIVVACSRRIKDEVMPQEFVLERHKMYAERLGIPMDDAIQLRLGIQNYNLFFPTYPFPLIQDGTFAAEQIIWVNPIPHPSEEKRRWIKNIEDPVAFAEEEFGFRLLL